MLVSEIVVPSKWDIIPLHTSDRATFKECRRKWYWSSPAHSNLVPKATIHGIYKPFWFGTGIHYALEKYYHPILKEDPEVVFDAWYDLQWNGGEVLESELEMFADRKPEFSKKTGLWKVQGLQELLPFVDDEDFEMHHQLGLGMMRYYKEYADREDDFTVISTEHTFSVPILKPDGDVLYMPDRREMPKDWEPNTDLENEYGPLMEWNHTNKDNDYLLKQVHARGRQDMIVRGNNTGNYAIMDHKTANEALSDDYFSHTDLDEQCTTYIWAAEIEAKLYDLPYKEIAGIVYQALRKAFPSPPTITTRGMPSINRQTEHTTAFLFEKTLKDMNMDSLLLTDDKIIAYYTYLQEAGDKQFILRKDVKRNNHQKIMAGHRIYMEAMDMLGDPYIYPNPTKSWSCTKCVFRSPCLAMESGHDYESMIIDGYESNHDR